MVSAALALSVVTIPFFVIWIAIKFVEMDRWIENACFAWTYVIEEANS